MRTPEFSQILNVVCELKARMEFLIQTHLVPHYSVGAIDASIFKDRRRTVLIIFSLVAVYNIFAMEFPLSRGEDWDYHWIDARNIGLANILRQRNPGEKFYIQVSPDQVSRRGMDQDVTFHSNKGLNEAVWSIPPFIEEN